MKTKMQNIISTLFIPVIAVMTLTGFFNEPEDTPVALIKKVVKDVSYRNSASSSDWENAKPGITLIDGNEVKTGTKSLALVLFTDGSGVLRVRENSSLQIYGKKENNKINKNTYIDQGQVGFQVNKQEQEEFTFTTPTVVASIRGTAGYVNVDTDSTTTIMCSVGAILLNSQMGGKQTGNLTGGNTAIIGKNGAIQVLPSTGAEIQEFNKSKNVDTKTLRIRTNKGTLEIDFVPKSEE